MVKLSRPAAPADLAPNQFEWATPITGAPSSSPTRRPGAFLLVERPGCGKGNTDQEVRALLIMG